MHMVEFPYKQFRPGQKELAYEVKSAVENSEILAVKAPTGFGKTSAVIYGHLLADAEKILFLVRTVNEITPVIRELKKFNEKYTIIISPRRTCPYIKDPKSVSVEDFWENCRIARLKGACEYYNNVENIDEDSIFTNIHSLDTGISSIRSISTRLGACPFYSSKRVINSARFIIATYPYFFKKDLFTHVFENTDYNDLNVIIDESHTLLNINSISESTINIELIDKAITEIKNRIPEYSDVIHTLNMLKERIMKLPKPRMKGYKIIDKNEIIELIREPELILDAAEELRFRIASEALYSLDMGSLINIRSYLHKVSLWIESLFDDDTRLFYSYDDRDRVVLVSTILDPALITREPLEASKSVVMMSGTMPPYSFLSKILGINRSIKYIDTSLLISNGKANSQLKSTYTCVASDVTTKFTERGKLMYSRIASYISIIHARIPGQKLVVYPSYEVMKGIVDKLPSGIRVYIEDRSSSIDDVYESLSDSDTLINAVAGGKITEGIEFLDEHGNSVIRTIIIVGVPYPQPDDYTREQLNVLANRLGESVAREFIYRYLAVVRVRQALGRAIRGPSDRAVFFLLDYRFLRKDLRRALEIKYDRVFRGLYGLVSVLKDALIFLESSGGG